MLYLKAHNQNPRDYQPMSQWGHFTRYLEIGDDEFAGRHVDLYENGHALKYDRSHWKDRFGMLADMKHDPKKCTQWWGPSVAIDAAEFEAVWKLAEMSTQWAEQVESAKMLDIGRTPVWLTQQD